MPVCTASGLDVLIENLEWDAGSLCCGAGPVDLRRCANEDSDLMWCKPDIQEFLEPEANRFDLARFRGKHTDDWWGPIEDRDCVGAIIGIAVGIGNLRP